MPRACFIWTAVARSTHFGVLRAPKIRHAARSTASPRETCSNRQGEREGERPGERHVSGGVHLQRAENPHKMRRSATLAEGKICYRVAIFSLLTGNRCCGGAKDSKAGRDPANPREA